MDFAAPLILVLLWILIGIPVSIAKKAAQNKPVQRTAQKAPAGEPAPAAPKPAEPEPRRTTIAPSISVTEHDDSIYRGSLNAVTGEGYDPCHEEQLAPLRQARESVPETRPQPASAGLSLSWTGSDIVRGFVMGEILNRKTRQ